MAGNMLANLKACVKEFIPDDSGDSQRQTERQTRVKDNMWQVFNCDNPTTITSRISNAKCNSYKQGEKYNNVNGFYGSSQSQVS